MPIAPTAQSLRALKVTHLLCPTRPWLRAARPRPTANFSPPPSVTNLASSPYSNVSCFYRSQWEIATCWLLPLVPGLVFLAPFGVVSRFPITVTSSLEFRASCKAGAGARAGALPWRPERGVAGWFSPPSLQTDFSVPASCTAPVLFNHLTSLTHSRIIPGSSLFIWSLCAHKCYLQHCKKKKKKVINL